MDGEGRNKMHIGFDVSQTGSGKAGCGFFAYAMIQAMLEIAPQHHYALYPSFGDFYFDALMPIHNPYKAGQYGPRHLTREMASTFWTKQNIEELLKNPDIVHANNFWCPTQLQSTRLIYTFYDMGFVVNPSWSTEANRLGCFNGVFRSALAADWVVAISEASKNHYLSVFPHFPEARIRVIYPCSRFANTQLKGKRPKALKTIAPGYFWLNVGTIEPRKNQRCLARAYARYLARNGKPMPLIFAGGEGWLMNDFKNYLHELGIEQHVFFTGYVSDEELIWLYQNCYANLYSSLFEGFGLPILEGMQFGAPTLNSLSTSMPEIAGTATILLPAEDAEEWTHAMLRLATNPEERKKMSMAAREQAAKFIWEHSAEALLNLYSEALAAPKRGELMKKTSLVNLAKGR